MSALDATRFLDDVSFTLGRGEFGRGMHRLFDGLRALRSRCSDAQWAAFRARLDRHTLRELIHADPMTRRSFEKPRGYAGDAVLLDYIYGERTPEEAPGLGRAVYDYAVGRAAARAVRHRKAWLAHLIDRAVDHFGPESRVLSVACGHLREGEDSAAVRNGWMEEFVALDADAESLAEVERRGFPSVRTLELSVARLLARPERLGRFHFAYSAGLYDYLDEPLAQRLTACLFKRLRPGGSFVCSNFLPSVPDAGYMETLMGWQLIYRDLSRLERLAAEVPRDQIAELRVHEDPFGAIGYLELRRR